MSEMLILPEVMKGNKTYFKKLVSFVISEPPRLPDIPHCGFFSLGKFERRRQ